MRKRIFLDVGANDGQTLAAVLAPKLAFDKIVCFEPARSCWPFLEKLADHRVVIERFGLWNQTGESMLHGKGKGASVWKRENKPGVEVCRFVRASDWFSRYLARGDIVFMKLNVEGAECDIIDDLLDSGEFDKISHLMVDFDVRKIASQRHREAGTRKKLEAYADRVSFSKEVMRGDTHAARIQNWLRMVTE